MQKVFIANRGEICRRIAITLREMGIQTVTYSSNKPSHFLSDVIDEFIYVENLDSSTYLNIDEVVANAKKLNCDAIHPGYGFASEQADFAEKVIAAQLTWIGPKPEAIHAMADKATARAKAIEAGVDCSKGVELKSTDPQFAQSAAEKTGYPLLIKAAFGGGGRGMRRVENSQELLDNLEKASQEALEQF